MSLAIIGKKIYPQNRGAYTLAKRFSEVYSLDFYSDINSKNIDMFMGNYDKLIFTYQVPQTYSINNIRYLMLEENNCMFYIREGTYAKICNNSISNGFSYYNRLKSHKHYIPYIVDYPYSVRNPDEITVGFYYRPTMVLDGFHYLTDFLMTSKKKINLVTCGRLDGGFFEEKYTALNTWKHTIDTEEFFNSITHYLCPMSATFEDPWPNMLMEAIQCGKQVIIPRLYGRHFTDGIDDMCSILTGGWHEDLEHLDKEYDNKNHGLTTAKFDKFNKKVIEHHWENPMEYNKYKSFYDWCSKEL